MSIKNILLSAVCCAPIALFANQGYAGITFPVETSFASQSHSSILHISTNEKSIKDAEKFVSKIADQGITFLSDKALTEAQRKVAFKKLLSNNFDMKTIARFALGRHWRSASKKQQAEYIKLFEKMVLNVYAKRFGEYSGQKLSVSGARPEGKRDILVHSSITDSDGGGQAVKVDWRIRKKNGKSKVIDIIVEGVSMSLTQRSDFSSVIQRGGGDVEVLLTHLREQ